MPKQNREKKIKEREFIFINNVYTNIICLNIF